MCCCLAGMNAAAATADGRINLLPYVARDVQPSAARDAPPTQGVTTETTAVAADGEVQGICRTIAASAYDDSPELAKTAFVSWLGVPPDGGPPDQAKSGQGQGLGKRLLSQSLVQMYKRGFRDSIISTSYNNYRGQIFYTNFGYSVSDWTHSFEKDLTSEGQKLVRPKL